MEILVEEGTRVVEATRVGAAAATAREQFSPLIA